MKKTLVAALLCSTFSVTTYADTLLGIYAGAQAWRSSTAGGFASSTSTSNFNFDDDTNSAYYVALEHPLPFVPNVKLIQNSLDSNGLTTLSSDVTFEGQTYLQSTDVMAVSDISSTDFILYYELFDNDIVSFDLGVNGKYIDGSLALTDTATATSSSGSFSGILPMLYSRVQVGIPFSGLSAYAEGSYLSFNDSSVSDYQIALVYSLIDSLTLDMSVQLGYRDVEIDIDDLDDVYANLEYDGLFAGVEVHF